MRYPTKTSKRKKYLIISLLTIVGIALCIPVFLFIKKLKDPIIPALKAVPESAVCLLEVKNVHGLYEKMKTKNFIWQELQGLDFFRELDNKIRNIDSIIKENEELLETLKTNYLYIAWVPDRNKYSLLFTINLLGPHRENIIDKFIRKNFSSGKTITSYKFLDNEIFQIYSHKKFICSYTVSKGIFIISESTGVIENSLSALLTKICFDSDPLFTQLHAFAGKKVDANFFIRNQYFDKLLSSYFNKNINKQIKLISISGEMGAFDLTLKNDELIIAGYLISDDTGQFLKKVFGSQSPQQNQLTSICPYNTALMYYWGIHKPLQYIKDYNSFMKQKFHGKSFDEMYERFLYNYEIDIHKKFIEHLGNEFALIVTENPNVDNPYHYYAIIKAKDIATFKTLLEEELSTVPEEAFLANRDSFAIRKLIPYQLLSACFGDVFSRLDSSYFTTINDYVVFGQSPLSLELFISGFLSGKTLNKNHNYLDFADNVAEEANFCFYANIHKSFQLLVPIFNDKLKQELLKNEKSLKNIQAIAFQTTNQKSKFYFNAYLKHNAAYLEDNPSVWEFSADTIISGKASVIDDFTDSTKKIVFFDALNNMYVLNRNGQLLWKKHINGAPLSTVFSAFSHKNKNCYLIFNTKNHIYIFDTKGNKHNISPVKLPNPASTAITIVDYSNNGDYRIIIPCENQIIYNFTFNGKPTPGWHNFRTNARLNTPVEYFRLKKKDALIATDVNGKVYFIDRRGKLLIKSSKPFIKAKNSIFYLVSDNNKQYLMTTDRKGKMIFVSENGSIEVVSTKNFSENHYFVFGDFNLDTKNDFIFFDNNQVVVFNHAKRKIHEASMTQIPCSKPRLLKIGKHKYYIVFPDSASASIVLFNNKISKTLTGSPTIGREFEISMFYGHNLYNILVSDSCKMMNFILN